MTSVGETLRRERLRRGFELEQISRELKISSRFLEAIEVDDFKKLPGGVFAKSFVRQYARLLSLDEEELATEVQRLVEPETLALPIAEQPRLVVPEIHLSRVEEWKGAGERRSFLPALAMVVVVMLLCSGIYSWWQRKSQQVSAHEQTATVTRPAPAATVAEVRPPLPSPQPQIQESPGRGCVTGVRTRHGCPAASRQAHRDQLRGPARSGSRRPRPSHHPPCGNNRRGVQYGSSSGPAWQGSGAARTDSRRTGLGARAS